MSSILLQMELDLQDVRSAEANVEDDSDIRYQNRYAEKFSQKFLETLPQIQIHPTHGSTYPCLQHPNLGPYTNEHRLEALNRCWSLIKYLQYTHGSKGQWATKFSQEGVAKRYSVDASHIPGWMAPKQDKDTEGGDVLNKTEAVRAADELPLLLIPIVWEKDLAFDGKEDLDDALSQAEIARVDIPDTHQHVAEDPRLSRSLEGWKDSIRRQFNCQRVRMNIRSLTLTYHNHLLSKGRQSVNVLRAQWVFTKQLFTDAANSAFALRVVFEALDDPEESVYESSEPPPALAGYFSTGSGNVAVNTKGVTAIANAAFGAPHQNPPPTTAADNGAKDDGTGSFLDFIFGPSHARQDIGSRPNPKSKFPRPEDHAALLKYYDGHDVMTEEGRRTWQREQLKKLTQNGSVAAVKIDKVPKRFTKDQKAAVEEAEDRGLFMAMGGEGEEASDIITSEALFMTNAYVD